MPTLQWIGKNKVISHHQDVPFKTLDHRYGFRADNPSDKTETHSGNKIIHGDNLEVLKALLPEYEGKIDCIFIDPPYNTGKPWVYNDKVDDPQIRKWLGQTVGTDDLEDFTRHDKWLCMMYPRLVLLWQLLSLEGAIFITVDDNEIGNLKHIMNDIFGSTCFVADIIWQKSYSPKNDSKGIPSTVDHMLVYGKKQGWTPNRLERTEDMDAKYKNPDNDVAPWTSSDACAPGASSHQGMVYAIQHPFTGKLFYPYNGAHWPLQQDDMLASMREWGEYELRDLGDDEKRALVCGVSAEEVRKNVKGIVLTLPLEEARAHAQEIYDRGPWPRFYFTNKGQGGMRKKTYLTNVEGKLITNLWPFSEVGHTDGAKKEIKAIFGGDKPFDTPKPTTLIEQIINIATNENSIILDSFAGSGTTGHATLKMNKKDKGNRKFILVELMDYAESITAERTRRVMTGYDWQGTRKEVLYSQKLTYKNLSKAQIFLNEAQQISEMNASLFDKVSTKVEDNSLKVIGEKRYTDKVDGLGGEYDFYELGQPLFKEDGNLNEEVEEEKIREYIYYTETHEYLASERNRDFPYLLDYYDGTGYFFIYEKDKLTTLSDETFRKPRTDIENYVVYADVCTLSPQTLKVQNIVFKKIPRDIKKL